MTRLQVKCLLVLLKISILGAFKVVHFENNSTTYCVISKHILQPRNIDQTALSEECEQQVRVKQEKLSKLYASVGVHVQGTVETIVPVNKILKQFVNAISLIYHSLSYRKELNDLNHLRLRIIISAIEAGRISEALAHYVILRSWSEWQSIVENIYQNPRRHRKHIENLLTFIRALPKRQDRLDYYYFLKKYMVQRKDHESYLGAMVAYDVHKIINAPDGKNFSQQNEYTLWSSMVDGAAGYFKRAFLVGENRFDFIMLDRDFPDLFDMMYPFVFTFSDIDMRKFNTWKMMQVLCNMHRPISKANMFQQAVTLLLERFPWSKHNEYYAPMLAGYLHVCIPKLKQDNKSKQMIEKLQERFSKFKIGANFNTLVKTIGPQIHIMAG
ncbi:uncharacterized protein LOC128728732 [Anopheles nili]|uniref:uncharacterized protein LOC128728732 n=1 Tax=Anopheles nili TaxID=185578 RepID=UPI00237ACAF5|nr:uncharacterized protein LOC128728732 [Anopheles nili]